MIGILTGGGDGPGLNPAIRAVTIRALREGYQVVGLRRGWLGAISVRREKGADNCEHFQILRKRSSNRAARTGETFLHTGRAPQICMKTARLFYHGLAIAHAFTTVAAPIDAIARSHWLAFESR